MSATHEPSASSAADDVREAGAVREPHRDAPSRRRRSGSPNRARIAATCARSSRSRRDRVRRSAGRSRPSAPPASPRRRSVPWSMIPTRSASTSASSRYCVVRNTVTPSSRASRATSSQSAVRLCGSSPVVGSSRKIMPRPVDEREREVETPLHPARVAAHLAVGRLSPGRRGRAARRSAACARPAGSPCSIVCSRRWSRPVSIGSSAASWSAAPITRAHLRPLA